MILAACGANPAPQENNGPVLLREVAVQPTDLLPTRILSPTPAQLLLPAATSAEVLSPLQVNTVDADFVLVTPTLPPSKTPTTTPTITMTPTITPTPSITATASSTAPAFPTSIIIPVTAPVVAPLPQICDSSWFFLQPRPEGCPLAPPTASQAVYQVFQNGYMVWIQAQDAIYVMYNDAVLPRWEVYRDGFDEGMAEDDPNFGQAPADNLWRPRRGFGMLWRGNAAVRERIGWATLQWEVPYSVQVQTSGDGTLFFSEPERGVFGLLPGGAQWSLYAGYAGFGG
ncbi:MAG: hypothetical protein OHK0046_01020 [Anaerolineae bacterium]